MKIILMVPEMDLGGVEEGTYDLAVGFKKSGHIPVIVSATGSYIPRIKQEGIRWIDFPMFNRTPWDFFRGLGLLKKILEKEEPHILHCRSRFPAWIGFYAVQSFPGTHFVTSVHGFHSKNFYSRILGRAERIIAVSKALKHHSIEDLKMSPEKMRVVYNGVNFEPFINLKKIPHKDFIVGSIGRFTEVKGYQDLVRAAGLLGGRIPGLKIQLTGSGNYEKYLRKLAKRLNLKNVFFAKGRSCEFFSNIDILVAPHISPEWGEDTEDVWLGRTAIEAQLSGIPVITTLKGIKQGDFLVKRDAVYVGAKDPGGIANAVMYLKNNPEEAGKIVVSAKAGAIGKFSVDTMVKKTLNVYEEVL